VLGFVSRFGILSERDLELLKQTIELGGRWAGCAGLRGERTEDAVAIVRKRDQSDARNWGADRIGTGDRNANRNIVRPLAGSDGQREDVPKA